VRVVENRIVRTFIGRGDERTYDGWRIEPRSVAWAFVWLAIGASVGYGVVALLDLRKPEREER
jgi:hypothetical protein